MCNFKQCIYAITDHIDEEDTRHEIFLFCSIRDLRPEDCPSDCTQSSVEPSDDVFICGKCGQAEFVDDLDQPVGCLLSGKKFSQSNPQPNVCDELPF